MPSQSVAIVTDSTAYIPKDLCAQYHIHVVPNVVNWGTQSYKDGVEISATEFFNRLKSDPLQPTTAVASPGEFERIYTTAAANAESVLALHISSLLSATYSAGASLGPQLQAQLNKPIEVIDSQATAMALGFVVVAAARAAAEGKTLPEVSQLARQLLPKVGLVFTVETLEYLRRGGRIGGAAAFVGGLLDMKPILELRNGRVEPVERMRTKKKAVERVLDILALRTAGKKGFRLAAVHAAAPVEAQNLLDIARARFAPSEAYIAELSPTVACHTGPGTVGFAFCLE